MLRQTSPKAASGSTGFAMLPSAHRKPERRDSKAFKMETQFNTGRAWFLSVALLLGTLGFVLVDHSSRTANLRGHLHARGHPRAHDGAADGEGRRGGRAAPEGHGGGGLVRRCVYTFLLLLWARRVAVLERHV